MHPWWANIDAGLLADADQSSFQLSDSADVAVADKGDLTFVIEAEFAFVKNEPEFLDSEGTLDSSKFDMFQHNLWDIVQCYLPEKLEISGVDKINYLFIKIQAHEISTDKIGKSLALMKLQRLFYTLIHWL